MKRFLMPVILIYALAIRIIGINYPFSGSMVDVTSIFLGKIAGNYLKLGYLPTKFVAVLNSPPLTNSNPLYYKSHPPLSPIMLSFFYRLFGISEWSTRIMPILFSLATLIVFTLFVRLFWNKKVAYISTLFMATMPIQVIYSQMADYQGSVLLFFAVCALYFYSKWFLCHRIAYLQLFFVSFILGALTDWPIFFLSPFLGLHYLLYSQRDGRFRIFLCITIASIVLFSAIFFYLVIVGGDLDILKAFLWRAGLLNHKYSLFEWLYNVTCFASYLFTPFIMLLSLLWFIFEGLRFPQNEKVFLVSILFLFGFLYITLFNGGSYIHDYWLFYLAPWASLSSAIVLERVGFAFSRKDTFLILICITVCLLVRYVFMDMAKRSSWVYLYMIFCIPSFAISLFKNLSKESAVKKNLTMMSLIFYLAFSCLQAIWDRGYWHSVK